MTMNGVVLPILSSFIIAGEEQGVPEEALSGTIQNDILKEFMVRNTYIYPPEPSMRIAPILSPILQKKCPNLIQFQFLVTIQVRQAQILWQELAFTLADGLNMSKQQQNEG